MRIVLFYSEVESFNYFLDQIKNELDLRGHETFVCDLRKTKDTNSNFIEFTEFASKKVDMAIAYDGIGIKEDIYIELWNSYGTLAVNILMDHPLRFHLSMEKHPQNYVQFCCDRNHVKYVEEYFENHVDHVEFMPHAGTLQQKVNAVAYKDRKYDILFSGTYYAPESRLQELDDTFGTESVMNLFYRKMAEKMLEHVDFTTEQALLATLEDLDLHVSEEQKKIMFAASETVEWLARMWEREQVVKTLADAGIEIWLLGRGWENHPSAARSNVHRIEDRIPFAETLPYMANAKINLNVMPWFKDGTHDRIFNSFMQQSLPLTDKSIWLTEHFTDEEDIVFYELTDLDSLPGKATYYLDHVKEAEEIINSGYQKVKENYIWKNCVNQILNIAEKHLKRW